MKEPLSLMGKSWRSMLAWCLPERCGLCRALHPDGFCPDCWKLLPWIEIGCDRCGKPVSAPGTCAQCMGYRHHVDHGLVCFHYKPPISGQIQMLKYSEQLHIARSLGKALAQSYIRSGLPRPDALVPVPLHPRRLRERGFNQASEICNTLGEELGISVRNGFLYRCLDTPSQTGLGESARSRNILDCFGTRGKFFGTHIALVDDVVTSGSTMREAAKTLKRAGIGAVSGWAVAATRRIGR